MTVRRLIEELRRDRDFSDWIVHHEEIPAKSPEFVPFPEKLAPELRDGLKKSGINRLYSHQAHAFDLASLGKDIVVVTPTASGKTLCYNLPVLDRLVRKPDARALYLFPIKALEQDQRNAFYDLVYFSGLNNIVRSEIYDGDTPQSVRKKILADPPQVIITNPDMLHRSILSYHQNWEKFLKGLEIVVLDELHTYRGVFGSHIVQVLRRLFRIAEHYGRNVQIIASSATIANPGELASALTGRNFIVLDKNGAGQAGRHFIFLNPEEFSTNTVSARLFQRSVRLGLKTICFTKARKITELIYTWISQSSPKLASRVSAYRAGYLPEERREIERRLFEGELLGVISTSALEMGIDIGELDVCILVGYPGTITQTWQRGGRVGRKERESLIVLIAQQNALDQYFMKHPLEFFASDYEAAVVDPENQPILEAHIECAASELLIKPDDRYFPEKKFAEIFHKLKQEGRLIQSVSDKSYRSRRHKPQMDVDIRSVGESWTIFSSPEDAEAGKRTTIGSVDGHRAFSECHPGAIYLHRARQYEVVNLDLGKKDIYVKPVNVSYYTQALSEKTTEILKQKASKPIHNFLAKMGDLRVHEQVVGYDKKDIKSQERLGRYRLDLPEQVFETVGLWIEIDDFIPTEVKRQGLDFMGGIHALEHAAISLFPLFAFCDRDDVGGISTPQHPQVGKSAIFIYDGYPGGVGLSERCYFVLEQLLEKTLEMLLECDCEIGCPACIQSPKCGSGNVPLDKSAAILILKMLLNKPDVQNLFRQSDDREFSEDTKLKQEPVSKTLEIPVRIMVFDLETKRSAQEVSGWGNTHLMGMALAVVWDSKDKAFHTFQESEVEDLIKKLKEADMVVGYNLIKFDYTVLSAYSDFDFSSLPTFDILLDLYKRLGFRISLGELAKATLNQGKIGDGLESLKWVKEGRFDLVEQYCKKDVELTRDIFFYGLEKRHLRFSNKGELMELSLDWDIYKILEQARVGRSSSQ